MRAAISVFVQGRYGQLMTLALAKLDSVDEAREIVGETIISALESLEPGRAGFRGRSPGELVAWLHRILKRRVVDRFRAKQRRIAAVSLDEEDEDGDRLYEPKSLQGDLGERVAILDAHRRVVERLSSRHRDVVELWWENRLAAGEIAQLLNESVDGRVEAVLTVDNVHKIISRYRAAMRQELGYEEGRDGRAD